MKDKIPPFPEIKCYGGLAKEKEYKMSGTITSSHESVMPFDDMKKLKMYFQTLWNIV